MVTEYRFNPNFEIVPLSGDRVELRLPMWGERLEASRYQVGILQLFDAPTSPEVVLGRYPFRREETMAFVREAIARGLLLAVGPSGQSELPKVVRARTPLLGLPAFDPQSPAAFAFLGVPFDRNTTGAPGARFGPEGIRRTSEAIHYTLDPMTLLPNGFYDHASGTKLLTGVTMADAGDVFVAPGEPVEALFDRVSSVVRSILDTGSIPFVLGGDHSISYPVLRAFPTDEIGIVHLDAHTDLGDMEPGGLHHGNVFTQVLDKLEFVSWIVQVGLRGVLEASTRSGDPKVATFGVDQLREQGVQGVIDAIPDDVPCYVSIDIDVLDPSFAPSTGTPVPGGLFPHELKGFLRTLARSRQVLGADLVEVGQPEGVSDSTAGLALECLLTLADGVVKRMQSLLAPGDNGASDG